MSSILIGCIKSTLTYEWSIVYNQRLYPHTKCINAGIQHRLDQYLPFHLPLAFFTYTKIIIRSLFIEYWILKSMQYGSSTDAIVNENWIAVMVILFKLSVFGSVYASHNELSYCGCVRVVCRMHDHTGPAMHRKRIKLILFRWHFLVVWPPADDVWEHSTHDIYIIYVCYVYSCVPMIRQAVRNCNITSTLEIVRALRVFSYWVWNRAPPLNPISIDWEWRKTHTNGRIMTVNESYNICTYIHKHILLME